MRIVTVQFENILDEELRDYGLLLKVFQYSALKHMPNLNFEIIKIPPPKKDPPKEYFMTKNTIKLDYWINAIKQSDEDTILMDCDMLVLKDMSCAFEDDFDIGYTIRKSKIPLNGGMVFVRPNERSIKFLERWKQINKEMYEDVNFHTPWRNKYAGMNQASFGYVLETYENELNLQNFNCREWNVCQEDWSKLDDSCYCLHVKSKLRRMCLSSRLKNPAFINAYATWKKYKKEAFKNG